MFLKWYETPQKILMEVLYVQKRKKLFTKIIVLSPKSLFTCCPQGKPQIFELLSVLGPVILKGQRKVRNVTLM